jgi:glutamate racemase
VNENNPIGIFDSGLGGLTVLKEIHQLLPNEKLIYLGDTARVPYGTKSQDTICRYSVQNSLYLLKHQVKAIVIACNTASSYSLDWLSSLFQIPVIGVIIPGAKAAINQTKNKKIGIFGTKGTIHSKSYDQALKKLDEKVAISSVACPLLVPLVEEGWIESKITEDIINHYWKELAKEGVDTLILGCTHYPMLKTTISKVVGDKVWLVDSAIETAKAVKEVLKKNSLLNLSSREGAIEIKVTDDPDSFGKLSQKIISFQTNQIEKINLD